MKDRFGYFGSSNLKFRRIYSVSLERLDWFPCNVELTNRKKFREYQKIVKREYGDEKNGMRTKGGRKDADDVRP